MLTENMQGCLVNHYFGNYSFSGLSPAIDSQIRKIRYCPECAADKPNDYYHRTHQLPGVTVCHIHGCPLVERTYTGGEETLTPSFMAMEYAKFSKDFLYAGYDCSFTDLKAAVLLRLLELGIKPQEVPAKIRAEGFDAFFKNIDSFMNSSFLTGLYFDHSSFAALLLFFFRDVDTLSRYLSPSEPTDEFKAALGDEYDLIGPYRSDVVHLRHHHCGQEYYVSPKFLEDGWECPCTYSSDDELFKRIVFKSGDGAYTVEGPFISSDKPVSLRHSECGNVSEIKPRRFLYEGTRCNCSNVISRSKAAQKVASLGDFELVDFVNTSSPMTVLHTTEGHTFQTTYHKFCKYPWCKKCSPRIRNAEIFTGEVADLVGDEYTVISEYVDKDTPVTIRHNTCGQTKEYLPRHFLDGVRCSHCSRTIKDDVFKDTVEYLSDGKYRVEGRQGKNKYLISGESGLSVELTKQKALQKLTRATPSPILPLDFPCKPFSMPRNSADKILNYLKAQYAPEAIIFLEDISCEGFSYTRIKANCGALVKSGVLKSAAPGVYVFPGHESTPDELISERYICRRGHHIGYWAPPVMAYTLGLTDEAPQIRSIVTNKEAGAGRITPAFGVKIRFRHGRATVDDSNYQVLLLMDLILSGSRYVKAADSASIYSEYIRGNKLEFERFADYFELYPDWVRSAVTKLYRNGVWGK